MIVPCIPGVIVLSLLPGKKSPVRSGRVAQLVGQGPTKACTRVESGAVADISGTETHVESSGYWFRPQIRSQNLRNVEATLARKKKGAVRTGHGVMCNICGRNCGKGGPLKKHIEGAHRVDYEVYKRCFYGDVRRVLADAWDDAAVTSSGETVITHVLVRRFIGEAGWPKVTRSARPLV
jgi:hypothetical protein